jgi:hypothetical protein
MIEGDTGPTYNYFCKHEHRYWRRHLNDRLGVAQKKVNEEAGTRILAIIQHDKDRALRGRLDYSMSKSHGLSARVVSEVDNNGVVTEHKGQDRVQEKIWSNVHDKQFIITEQAPVCKGNLRKEFRHHTVTEAAKKVLEGSCNYEQGFDQSTKELMQKCKIIRYIILACSADIWLRRQHWQQK